jgi:hypothetical protein
MEIDFEGGIKVDENNVFKGEPIVENIKKIARLNSSDKVDNLMLDIVWVKLNSIEHLDELKDELKHPYLISNTEEYDHRRFVRGDIEAGITFGFWYDSKGKLLFER